MIRALLNHIRNRKARKREEAAKADLYRRLDEIVQQTRDSYAITDYRKRRAAALKGRALKRERQHG